MNNEEKILSILETLSETVNGIQLEQQNTNHRLTNLEQDVKEIKSDVKVIKEDIQYLKSASDYAFRDIDLLDDRIEGLRRMK